MIETLTKLIQQLPIDSALWLVVFIFICLDVIAGTTKAFVTKTISSEKARKGIGHKMGYFLAMFLCTLIDMTQQIVDIGYVMPLLPLCAVLIIATEIFSLCEHIADLNPDINLDFLRSKEK